MTYDNNKKINDLAKKIMSLARSTIILNMRFMDSSLSFLKTKSNYNTSLCTDGVNLYYNPKSILKLYRLSSNAVASAYMHIVLHCVFKHFYVDTILNSKLWDLSCDMAVENIIFNLGYSCFDYRRDKQAAILQKLNSKISKMTAEKIYDYYLNNPLSDEEIEDIHSNFMMDDHSIWYLSLEKKYEQLGLLNRKSDSNSNNLNENNSDKNNPNDSLNTQDDISADKIDNQSSVFMMNLNRAIDTWSKISKNMQTDLETTSKNQGDQAGDMLQNLKAVNREKYDYAGFLKQFATINEVMKINDEEFDYVFYSYGLGLYKNMPLIEPLEYKEINVIKEFVIAIDTSGSVSGELVQKFVQKTYNILMQEESFAKKINIHILQCDTIIQESVKITSRKEFDEYLKTMILKGFGGTDFRPVFDYVNKKIAEKEFANLKGVIYFTDGYGDFPAKQPDYKTAFVFIDDEYQVPEVPVWAIRLVLESAEI